MLSLNPRRVRRRRPALLPTDPLLSARLAGLRYVRDDRPGILRQKAGRGFRYVDSEGRPVRDRETLRRIRSLVIPPAWTDVWICPSPQGYLQATGRDARGRKQYRYHPLYRAVRDQTKYSRMLVFGEALPSIRRRVREDLARSGLPRERVLATVVRLLETTLIRVGNEEYVKENNSYGLTTLRDEHVEISGSRLRFRFRGKSGKEHEVEVTDRRVAAIVKRCQDLPGEELFAYVNEGEQCTVSSEDVNQYLREITGQDFTAKDFRTWNGTVLAALALEECGPCSSETETKKNIVAAVKNVAEKLGNRPATCRKYYLHPAVLEAYSAGSLLDELKKRNGNLTVSVDGLRPEELCLMGILQQCETEAVLELKPAV
jgi:DNA topoisomerase-1